MGGDASYPGNIHAAKDIGIMDRFLGGGFTPARDGKTCPPAPVYRTFTVNKIPADRDAVISAVLSPDACNRLCTVFGQHGRSQRVNQRTNNSATDQTGQPWEKGCLLPETIHPLPRSVAGSPVPDVTRIACFFPNNIQGPYLTAGTSLTLRRGISPCPF
jgi:hypothetical protein